MFCKQCGTSMNDDVKFCPNCGTPSDAAAPQQQQPAAPQQYAAQPQPQQQQQQPAAPQQYAAQPQQQQQQPAASQQYAEQQQQQPAAPQQYAAQQPAAVPSEFSKNAGSYVRGVWDLVKPFFSAAPTKAVAAAAKNKSHSWIAIGVIGAFVNAIATLILVSATIGQFDRMMSYANTRIISYGQVFGLSLLFGLLFFGFATGALMLLIVISRKKVAFASVANVVSVSAIPVISVLILNMIIALIYPLATIVLLLTSVLMAIIMMYVGVQQLERFEKSPFWLFSGMLLVLAILDLSIFGAFIRSILENVLSAFGSGLGSMFF